MSTQAIRRSIALSKRLVDELSAVAPPELRRNWNRLVTTALEEYARARRSQEFELSMARMACDSAIRKECGSIQKDFAHAESDGLRDD